MKVTKRNMIAQLHIITKKYFRAALTDEKLTGISVLDSKRTIFKKLKFYT